MKFFTKSILAAALSLCGMTAMAQEEAKTYNGFLDVSMAGEKLTMNQLAQINITPGEDNKCKFELPDFQLGAGEEAIPVGDIVIENVSVTEADGVSTYAGKVDNLELLEGMIVCNVSVSGTISSTGNIDFTIPVVWIMSEDQQVPIDVTFKSKLSDATAYQGYLNIEMAGEPLAQDQASKIEIGATLDENVCVFMLPDFTLKLGEDELPLGNIIIPQVKKEQVETGTAYSGEVKDMSLLDGMIIADVALTGVVSTENVVEMNVVVMWGEVPISVQFSTNKKGEDPEPEPEPEPEPDPDNAVSEISMDCNAAAAYYDLQGRKVSAEHNGLIIVKQGNKVVKIIK